MILMAKKLSDGSFEQLPAHWGDRYVETYEYAKGLTNRQLLKELRLSSKHYEDVRNRFDEAWDYYLGKPIREVLNDAKKEYTVYKFLVTQRYEAGSISKASVTRPF